MRNVATVTGDGPSGVIPPASDPAIINSVPLPDPALAIVKTVVLGPDGDCPVFADGVVGLGEALTVLTGQTVTYCIAIQNTGAGDATNVLISDDQAPEPIEIGSLPSGEGRLVQYDVVVGDGVGLVNTATLTGTAPDGEPHTGGERPSTDDTPTANITLIHSVSKADEECITVAKNLNSLVANQGNPAYHLVCRDPEQWFCATHQHRTHRSDVGDGENIDVSALIDGGVLQPGEWFTVPFEGEIPDTGLISSMLVQALPSDADGNLVPGAARVRDDDSAEVREASIDIETTVAAGADADCADAVEVLLIPG